jgi:hypothetical protein
MGKMWYIVKLASLAICESRNLRDSQTSKIIIDSEKLVFDPKFLQDSRVEISNDSRKSCYEISICKTCKSRYKICLRDSQEASLATKFLSARLVRSDSCYEISVCKTCEKRVSLLILTRKSYENFVSKKRISLLARISKSDSRVNPRSSPPLVELGWMHSDAHTCGVQLAMCRSSKIATV